MSAVKIWLLAMLIPVCWSAQSALHKAHEFFQYGLYTEALKQFEKSIRSESMLLRSEALMGAARSAEQTNNNLLAERYWLEYIQQIPDSVKQDTVLWMLSKILIVNENYKEAQLYLNTYLSKHPEYRNFPKVRSLQLVISQRLHLLPQDSQSEYEVEPTNVSTPESEYAPFFHKKTGTFWFVREQKFYDFVNFQSDRSSGPPAMAIWSAEYKNQQFHAIKNPASLINPEKHMGPLVFSNDGSMACYSQTSRFAELNRPVSTQLLLARKPNSVSTAYFQKHVFQFARPLPFSSDSFFTSHPAFSPDGKELIFSSNRSGSVGGKDLWSVRIDTSGSNIQFSNLRPLGPDINTSEDELAPVFKSSNELIFASNGHPGFGGLDLFSARRINDQWVFYGNEGLKLNSGGDDFGICFTSDSTGFFASNRINGKGKDDIYKFVFRKRLTEVKGILWFSKNKEKPVVNTWVYLKDENGKLIDSVKTNRKGFFVFRQLPVGTKYMISFSEDTSVVFSNYVLSDENGIISDKSMEQWSSGRFAFKNLPLQNLVEETVPSKRVFLGRIMLGQETQLPFKHAKIQLTSNNGQYVKTANTSDQGTFLIRDIPPDGDYDLQILSGDSALPDGTRINLYSREGKLLRVVFKTSSAFSFKLLQSDRKILDELDISDEHSFSGKLVFGNDHKALPHVTVDLIDENGKTLQRVETDSLGRFIFNELPQDKAFSIALNSESEIVPEGAVISLANRKGDILRNFLKEKNRFVYKHVAADRKLLNMFEIDEAEAFSVNLYGCFFDQNQEPLANKRFKIVNNKTVFELKTNAEGKFNLSQINPYEDFNIETFENDTSFQRITRIFMTDPTGQVIKVAQLQFGKFEFKLLATERRHMTQFISDDTPVSFKSGFTDSDLPLRFIGKIGIPKYKRFLSSITVQVINNNDSVIASVKTNSLGQFMFEDLPKNQNWSFELNQLPDTLPFGSVVVLYDNSGKVIKQFAYENNRFVFKILNSDVKIMSDLISELPDEFSTELFGFLLDQHRKPIAKAQFKVLVEGESKAKNIQTDELGRFSLKNLNPYLNYEVETQPEDPSFKGITRIYITDQQKQIIKVADISFGKFSFKILHSDRMQLSELAESKEDVFSSRVDDYARSIKNDTLNAKSFSLPHIYYHLGEVQYDSTSRDILQQALDSLTANPQFKLKIHSHTDAISPDYFNMDLSIRRALYIRTYFITQGISIKRISYKGFGETKILNECKEGVECPEENHRVNRRTELTIYTDK